jgi:hypothetical protein
MSVLRRSETGPLVTEKDFDRRVLVPEIKRVVKEYDIKYDPETPVPSDDSLAKDIWNAGMDYDIYRRRGQGSPLELP